MQVRVLSPRREIKMRNCNQCGKTIPSKVEVEGKIRNFQRRRTCLDCNPFLSGSGYDHRKRSWTDSQLQEAAKSENTITGILIALGLRAAGSNYRHIQKHIKRLEIDVSHIAKDKSIYSKNSGMVKTPSEILCEKSKVSRGTLKNYLLKTNLIPYICLGCSCSQYEFKDGWLFNNKLLVLTIEHKNGIADDNRLENICWLCPNCHSQTSTFAGRKTK